MTSFNMTGMETPTDSQVSGRTRRQGIRTLQEYIAQRSVARHSCGKAIAISYPANPNERHKQSAHIFFEIRIRICWEVEKAQKTQSLVVSPENI